MTGTIRPAQEEPFGHQTVLDVRGLTVAYASQSGPLRAVNDVSFAVRRARRLAIIGESGSGKTTLATALMRMTRAPASIGAGQIVLNGRDIMALGPKDLPRIRLREIALVPQGAMNSLNPVMRIGEQIKDGIKAHEPDRSKVWLRARTTELLEMVGLPGDVADRYPHQLSGGMKQRVVMAIAASLGPTVLLADEPTSALDVVVQRQILQTLADLQRRLGAAVVLIGHDMGLVAQFADEVAVMYAGRIVEIGPVEEVIRRPKHPYTRLLVESLPSLESKGGKRGIPGLPPSLRQLPSGCSFAPRCPWALDTCLTARPLLQETGPVHAAACHLYPVHADLPPRADGRTATPEVLEP